MRFPRALIAAAIAAPVLPACATAQGTAVSGDAGTSFSVTPVAEFDGAWAMTFLQDGNLLVTEQSGKLFVVGQDGGKTEVAGVPDVAFGGQGGLGDIVPHPDFASNGRVYLSYAEPGDGGLRGAAVAMATLARDGADASLDDVEVIWRQQPKVSGNGHYSHRIAFAPDGKLFISSGDRQKQAPAQDMAQNLGKIIRLNDDGSVPSDNPFQDQGELAKSFWSVGHRNTLGIAFDAQGRLWQHEMGPKGGDELNLVEPGQNYGWPVVSYGTQYNGTDIPDHPTRPEFAAPQEHWTPVISPSSLIVYSGDMFPDWKGHALVGGLSARGLIQVELGEQEDGTRAAEAERFPMGARIREVEQGPDGAVWLLEDDAGGRLLKLTPAG